VGLRLEVHDTQGVCDRGLAGERELGVVGAARAQRGLEFEVFMRDELVVIVPPDDPLASIPAIDLETLAAQPLIMQQPGSGVRSVLMEAFRSAGIREPRMDMEIGLQQSVKAAVLDGLGVTVISRLAVAREVADGALAIVPIAGEGLARDFHWVRPSGRTPRRVTTAFLEFARDRLPALDVS
jgi:DNA-binding transcriptional LysR family regulator